MAGALGRKASYGCIRMRSKDVIALYSLVHIGDPVRITDQRLEKFLPTGDRACWRDPISVRSAT